MCVREVSVPEQTGSFAFTATIFVQNTNKYKSSIWVERSELRVNAKSLLGVLALGISGGMIIKIIADGSDEESAVDCLVKLIESSLQE
jgi:phosphocarrier protein